MSGGAFDDTDRTYPTYERKTIEIMKRAVYVLRMAYIYAKRVDWMLSGDDGEDTLVERLQEELQALKSKYPSGKFTFKEKDVSLEIFIFLPLPLHRHELSLQFQHLHI